MSNEAFYLLDANALKLKRNLYALFAPKPIISTSQWAAANLYLSKEEGPEPGLYSCKDLPWQAVVMDAIDSIEVETLVIKAASQVGKTTISKGIMGKAIDLDPSPMLNVQSTQDAAKEYSNTRLKPMFRDCPIFKDKLHSDDTYLKTFAGGYIAMAWSQSPTTLASKTIKYLFADEVDRWPVSSGSEGDPLDIAKARTENYPDSKHIFVSSPTVKDGRINVEFESTSQNKFYVNCPHCDNEHHMDFLEQIRMVDDRPDTAMLACPSCGGLYGDADLPNMVKHGRFIPRYPERKKHVGFEISRLMVPNWTKLNDLADKYLKAKNNPEMLQVFVNTQLGEIYEDKKGKVSSAKALAARRENYDHLLLPEGILFLVAGVDTQDDRLEIEIVGFGMNDENWGIQHIVLMGDPSEKDVWTRLNGILLGGFDTADGRRLRIAATCIDSGGHHTQRVYEFCHNRTKRNVWAIKGREGALPMWPSRASKSKTHGKFQVRIIGVDTIKDTLFARFRKSEGEFGYCHFPHTYDELITDAVKDEEFDYFAQITAERRVAVWDKRNRQYYTWTKDKHRRNEALDCRVYAWAAMVGLVQERRLNIEQLAQVKQFALFKGDPATSEHAVGESIDVAEPSNMPSTQEIEPAYNKPVKPQNVQARKKTTTRGRRTVRSGYVGR